MQHLTRQRARGSLTLSLRRRGPATVLADLRQDGCLKLRFPRAPDGFQAVLLNSSGGVAGGDSLTTAIAMGPGAAATLATQAAERFYRALPDDAPATVATRLDLADDACAEWLPQETILFDDCALARTLDVRMAETAVFLGVEMLVFGRAAMGETVRHARIADTIRIRRAGRLILHDAIRLSGDVAATLATPATAAGGRAIATLLYVAPDAARQLDPLRAALDEASAEAGASAWDGMLVARLVSPDAAALRASVVAGLRVLRQPRSLPRVWQC